MNNNKMGIIQVKYLIKIKIGFFKETFAYMVLVTILAFPKFLSFLKLPSFPKFSRFPKSQMKGLSKWSPLP